MKSGWIIAIVVGAIAGIVIAVLSLKKQKKTTLKPFALLLDRQVAEDHLTGTLLKKWFIEAAANCDVKTEGLLMSLTEQHLKQIGYECPLEMNANYLIQVLMEADSRNILSLRLISYVTIEDGLKSHMGDNGILLIEM